MHTDERDPPLAGGEDGLQLFGRRPDMAERPAPHLGRSRLADQFGELPVAEVARCPELFEIHIHAPMCSKISEYVKGKCSENKNGRCSGFLHAGRMQNRIAELRNAKGWSLRELAARVNSSVGTVHGLEKGDTRMNTDWIEKFSSVFEVSAAEFLGLEPGKFTVLAEDVSPWQGADSTIQLGNSQRLYEVKTSALDQVGIWPGVILVVDVSPAEMTKISTGDAVLAQIHQGSEATMLLRQFIEPSILITNSSVENSRVINLRKEDAVIKGVVVASHQRFRQKSTASTGT
jgi:transcriptional regulator with XRE-family HTH domain